jgi:PAS domain S-box-containing protein
MSEQTPNLAKNIHFLEDNKDFIVDVWVSYKIVQETFKVHAIDTDNFKNKYVYAVLEYLINVAKGVTKIGDCPVMHAFMKYLVDKDFGSNDLYIICSHFRNAMTEILFQEDLMSPDVYKDIMYIFDRNFAGVLMMFTGVISEHEEALEKQIRQFKEHERAYDEAAMVSKSDLNGTITAVNDHFCRVTGFSQEELIGKNSNILKHPSTSEKVMKSMWATITDKKVWRGQLRNLKKNGKTFISKIVIVPILAKNNEITEYIAIYDDITKDVINHKKLEESLKQNLEYRAQGAEREAQKLTMELQIAQQIKQAQAELHSQNMNKHKNEYEELAQIHDEEMNNFATQLEHQQLKYETELFENAAMSQEDLRIKALEKDKERLEAVDEAKNNFLVVFTHELKTPLNAVINYGKYLGRFLKKQTIDKQDEIIGIVDDLVQNGQDMLENITDILEVSRLTAGKMKIEKVAFYLDELVERNIQKLNAIITESDSTVEKNLLLNCSVDSDVKIIERIFSNFLSNAAKYGKDVIVISLTKDETGVTLIVEDNGEGISDKETVFNLFEQGDKDSFTRQAKGTGVGLYYVKVACDALGVDLKLEDSELGGAKFSLFFSTDEF